MLTHIFRSGLRWQKWRLKCQNKCWQYTFTHMLNVLKHFFSFLQFLVLCCENAVLITQVGFKHKTHLVGFRGRSCFGLLGSVISKKAGKCFQFTRPSWTVVSAVTPPPPRKSAHKLLYKGDMTHIVKRKINKYITVHMKLILTWITEMLNTPQKCLVTGLQNEKG